MLDAGGHVRDEMFARTPLAAGDEKYADIDGCRMKDLVREVVAISLKTKDDKTRYWGRIAGTSGEAMAADWVEAGFKKAGLTVTRRKFALPPQWFPLEWAVSFESGGKSMTFPSLLPASRSKPTPAAGVDLEVVWVGTGTAADFAGRDVKGKAVLIHSIPAPGSMGHSAAYEGAIERAQEKGAAAVGVVYGISDNFAVWQGLGGGEHAGDHPRLLHGMGGRQEGSRDAREGAGGPREDAAEDRRAERPQVAERLRRAARRHRRRDHRHGAHGRLLRGGARQRVRPVGDDGAGRSLREDSQGAAPAQHPVHRPGRPPCRIARLALPAREPRRPSSPRPCCR